MTRFAVPDMSCGHCTAAIEKSIKSIDATAEVTCDLDTRQVQVDSVLDTDALSEAIRQAGYDATPA
ncbi:MAG: cation transporter [Sediminimonas sp.]|uniref:heavy-metal-associated domain-containing protein n=1 Tax=Sediminimonas sp. TaxID=2823379 RepID=UPI0028708362|nr:cation transporter [Sediminimonas sp.]MDR9484851.1 cation transporter [Sediminimonas sp.]